jgi:hypothetical protein
LVITSLVSYRTIRLSERTIEQSSNIAVDYEGTKLCREYRAEVASFKDKGLAEDAIRQLLSAEKGRDPNEPGNAYQAYEAGCGGVERLYPFLPTTSTSP